MLGIKPNKLYQFLSDSRLELVKSTALFGLIPDIHFTVESPPVAPSLVSFTSNCSSVV